MPTVADFLADDGPVARRLDGFEVRPQQLEMAAAVEGAFESRGRLLIEAGTGVGKSFAYLLPAIRRVVEHRERVVVSTHTINLQEQLIDKDLPLLNAVIPAEFSAVLVKGRSNYVSLRRLRQASARQERLFTTPAARAGLHEVEDWAYDTSDGTLSSLPQLPRGDVWDHVQSDSHNCMGRKCETYEKCFYQAARRRMENGDLLVCNHALFFSDLALRSQGHGFLPPYDHVILDEAHTVEDVAAEHFGISLAEGRVAHLLNVLYEPNRQKGFLSTVRLGDGATDLVDRTIEQTLACRARSEDMFDELVAWYRRAAPQNGRIAEAGVVDNHLSDAMRDLAGLLTLLRERAANDADGFELASYSQRAADVAHQADALLGQRAEGCVYWLDGADGLKGGVRGRRRRLALKCMAVDVAPVLREQLFDREVSVVMTSATLATRPGDFSHVSGRLGADDADAVQLGSPFHHAEQMQVLVDPTMPPPTDAGYVDALVPRIEESVRATDGGAFILFTSYAMLERVAECLRGSLGDEDGFPLLVQRTDGPPGLLLNRFRETPRAVLLGTASFWQGVDVRGEGLRNVIITRLPFDVPDRPLVQARHELIESRGGNAFVEDQLPKAIIRFKQGVGRLIRSHGDSGQVVILDPRVLTKAYGKQFLSALPEDVHPQPLREADEY